MAIEQLLPSLLERLTDDAPGEEKESSRSRTINVVQLREAVIRDLGWLLNATRLESVENLDGYPEVRRSVLNYGLPGLSGMTAGSLDFRRIEREMRDTVVNFEPRLLPHTVVVRAVEGNHHGNSIVLRIEGQLWALPVPVSLLVQSEFDLETGQVSVASV